jgi:S1-C subfamily serine protease
MFKTTLQDKIKQVSSSVVAVGFTPDSQHVTIIGSGFCITDDGKILTAAHVWNQIPENQRANVKGFVLSEEMRDYFQRYKWIPMKLIKKDDASDLAVLQLEEYKDTLLKKLKLGDSDALEMGQDVYFIGFPYAAQLINDGFGVSLIANKGIVSSIKRDGVNPEHPRNWIFVDTITNPGDSGCPLIDIDTNMVVGVNTISFRIQSQVMKNLDIREPMHIAGAKPINLAKKLLNE